MRTLGLCILFFTGFYNLKAQNDWATFVQSSPEGAQITVGDKDLGRTPNLIKREDFKKANAICLSYPGYAKHCIELDGQSTIAIRLKPKDGYNRTAITSKFTANYTGEEIFLDPMVFFDESKDWNCINIRMRYKVLGTVSPEADLFLKGCDLNYLSRYSTTDEFFSAYQNLQGLPFPIQQEKLNITPLLQQNKKLSRKKKLTGKVEQLWYLLAQQGSQKLFVLPISDSPGKDARKFNPILDGDIPNRFSFFAFVYQDTSYLEFVSDEKLGFVCEQFTEIPSLQKAYAENPNLVSFTEYLINDPTCLGSIFQESWDLKFRRKEASPELDSVYKLLENRDGNQVLSIGGEQDYMIDSSRIGSGSSNTEWYLKGIERDQTKTKVKADPLFYDPEDGMQNESKPAKEWYLKNIDTTKAVEIKVDDPKFKNPAEKNKREKVFDKPWYLRDN